MINDLPEFSTDYFMKSYRNCDSYFKRIVFIGLRFRYLKRKIGYLKLLIIHIIGLMQVLTVPFSCRYLFEFLGVILNVKDSKMFQSVGWDKGSWVQIPPPRPLHFVTVGSRSNTVTFIFRYPLSYPLILTKLSEIATSAP